jgi:PQQ-dependent catabolism-associated CXXCW motif protein
MRLRRPDRAALATLGLALGLTTSVASLPAQGQDAFPGTVPKRPATTPAPSTSPPAAPVERGVTAPPNATPRGSAAELQDFGVAPISQLRPTDRLHAPTPTTIPGGRVVSTQQLAQWLQAPEGRQGRVLLLHALLSREHLPNALPAAPALQGGSFDDQVQQAFGDYLKKVTGDDRSRTLVTYCQGVQCWGSYNAALRALRLGYTNVYWYRGGLDAWKQAGLPVVDASR